MYYSITAKKDATIYERSESLNAGIDEILEIQKTVSSSNTVSIYNSRILIKYDLSSISKSMVDGNIPNIAHPETSASVFLKLYTTRAASLSYKYGIEAYPISESWDMGQGRATQKKITPGGAISFEEEGVSWKFRDGKDYFGNTWTTDPAKFSAGTTGSYSTTPGGATWHVSSSTEQYVSTEKFDYEKTDISIDVSKTVRRWLDGTIPNEGFILLRSGSISNKYSEEQNSRPHGTLQFYSTDSHTVYQPRLEFRWDDSSESTGSLSPFDVNKNSIIYLKDNVGKYKKDNKHRFRLVGREKYPTKTYDTVSAELAVKYLPTTTYYALKDSKTGEVILPFNTGSTKLSCDSTGNYLDLWMDQLYAGRRYSFMFKIVTGSIENIYDNDYSFKVVI